MQHSKTTLAAVFFGLSVTLLSGCDILNNSAQPTPKPATEANQTPTVPPSSSQETPSSQTPAAPDAEQPSTTIEPTPATPQPSANEPKEVDGDPDSLSILVNKQYKLPDHFKPADLVDPNVPFIFKGKSEKRMMRKEAAEALEKMFAGAKKDGIQLAGVSAYRSEATQRVLFENYVKKDGEEAARKYSALPGTSEHETGLAIDVSGSTGACAAQDCFGDTKEAAWLAKHAAEYGFIIRYPEGKDSITGYQYEPWHLRYVGNQIAGEISGKNITLEEYLNAVPATASAN
ncbi:D-alanyl-D-alanine carboxypeptidase family protein [Brevibacillus fluminis]|uniref:D-alanyl-D-alanine carboxypeptidase family protein n=1 Tax=Brevibacillus fluminis TaxID=511487 RepID=A0A3M8DIE7_9BACL|nr:M15 family metallopeptidase [Brevibacillus fluminis]RNB87145.1 D-alanyl-D-alanine carboxypeptidase family protein [Brevibacillus fluminis]